MVSVDPPTTTPLTLPAAATAKPAQNMPNSSLLTPLGPMGPSVVTPSSTDSVLYTLRAAVLPFRESILPPLERPVSFNDDLLLGSFRPRKLVWSGEQRRGISMQIADAASIQDHAHKAMGQDFFLSKDIPLPGEIPLSLEFTTTTPYPIQGEFWREQLDRVQNLVGRAEPLQKEWYSHTPNAIRPATGKFRFLAFMMLMGQYGLGGKAWLRQFVWGFPITGDLSQAGVYPRDPSVTPAPDTTALWGDTSTRLRARAAGSGWLNADTLWTEAIDQVQKGWLMDPLTIGEDGKCPAIGLGAINISFRFGVEQSSKLRACDDLKYGTANTYCAVMTPIKLPTWDHIAQMAAIVRPARCAWSFFKADHASAYKQLPLGPSGRPTSAVALREPRSGAWRAFSPRALLFGSVAAVLHYNCVSRAVAAVFTKVTGIPLLSYFDDFGPLAPLRSLTPHYRPSFAFSTC